MGAKWTYSNGMTLDEIKTALKAQGLTVKQLAERLGMSYTNTRLMLNGSRPMSEQISRHISFVLGAAKTQMVVVTVDLPDAVARVWAPGWEQLSDEERSTVAHAVAEAALAELVQAGHEVLEEQTKQPGGGAATVGAAAPAGTEPYAREITPYA